MHEGNNKPLLNIVVALSCEARPLLSHYRLKKISRIKQLPVYQNQEKTIFLIESGIGKIKSAAATAFLQAFTSNQQYTCYLNIGIAGAKTHELGEALLINRIQEGETQKKWFPRPFSIPGLSSTTLLTVNHAQKDYPQDGMVDMEGSGYFQTASQFVSQEQVQLLKIVSDNHYEQQTNVKPKKVELLIEKNLDIIDQVVNLSLQLSSKELKQTISIPNIEKFLNQWHFTQYQQHELTELLRRWHILCPDIDPFLKCYQLNSAKNVIQQLTENLDQLEYSWE